LVDVQTIGVLVTATSVTVAAIYYIMTLRVQQANMKSTLETRQAQLLMAVYDKLAEPQTIEMWTKIVNTDYTGFPEFKKKFIENPEMLNALYIMTMRFEGFGLLVRDELLDIRHVALMFGGVTTKFFEKVKPVLGDLRGEMEYSRFMDQTEYLYNCLIEYMEKHPELKT
jgi:hypothetical protein